MLRNSPKTILWLLPLLLAVTGCQQEDIQLPEERNVMGRIVLNLSDIDVYVDAQTRATQTLNAVFPNFVFTLNGTDVENVSVNKTISFENGVAIIKAGTYTLTASNLAASQTGNGCPHYEGSASFTLEAGETQTVSIGSEEYPLTPQNAKVTLKQEGSFSTLYINVRVTLTAGGRSVDIGDATGCETEAFFPAGTVSYSITAKAIKNTHVTDITGATGTITLQAGKAYTITLAASPVSGQIIPLIEGTHSDYFD